MQLPSLISAIKDAEVFLERASALVEAHRAANGGLPLDMTPNELDVRNEEILDVSAASIDLSMALAQLRARH